LRDAVREATEGLGDRQLEALGRPSRGTWYGVRNGSLPLHRIWPELRTVLLQYGHGTRSPQDWDTLFQDACQEAGRKLPERPRQRSVAIPVVTAFFTGREDVVGEIVAAVRTALRDGRPVPGYAIDGLPGVGKSALATKLARELVGDFPDGGKQLNLWGHTEGRDPLDPVDALVQLLQWDGVDVTKLPRNVDALHDEWLSRTIDRQAVFIFDNAISAETVGLLWPGSRACLVLVTSRAELSELNGKFGITMETIEPLPPADAVRLFEQLTGASLGEEAQAVARDIVELCDGLPEAIRLVAHGLHKPSRRVLATRLQDLRNAPDLLGELDRRAPGEPGIRRAFTLSYLDLDDEQRRLLRALALSPVGSVDEHVATALSDPPADDAVRDISTLDRHRLVQRSSQDGRYRMHDLVRAYGRRLASSDPEADRHAVLGRLFAYYQYAVAAAGALLNRHIRPVVGPAEPPRSAPRFDSAREALAWLREDRANLHACIDAAAAAGWDEWTVRLTAAAAPFLRTEGPWQQAADLHSAAAEAAERLGDPLAEANALNELGGTYRLMSRSLDAVAALERAADLYARAGSPVGQASALNELGVARDLRRDRAGSERALADALRLYQEAGEELGQANVIHDRGAGRFYAGRFGQAESDLTEARDRYRSIPNRLGEAHASMTLAKTLRELDRLPRATEAASAAMTLYEELGNEVGRANTMTDRGDLRLALGDHAGAAADYAEALSLHRRLGNRRGEALSLAGQGRLRIAQGARDEGIALIREGLAILDDVGHDRDAATLRNLLADLTAES
jgi:tetratricopeptide (TPR) repeat protein